MGISKESICYLGLVFRFSDSLLAGVGIAYAVAGRYEEARAPFPGRAGGCPTGPPTDPDVTD